MQLQQNAARNSSSSQEELTSGETPQCGAMLGAQRLSHPQPHACTPLKPAALQKSGAVLAVPSAMGCVCFLQKYGMLKHIYQLINKSEAQHLSCFLCALDYKNNFQTNSRGSLKVMLSLFLMGKLQAEGSLPAFPAARSFSHYTCPSPSTFQITLIIYFSITRPSSKREKLCIKKALKKTGGGQPVVLQLQSSAG